MRGWSRYDGLVGLMKRYSENCWPSTPPPLLVFSSKLLLRSWAITCIVSILQCVGYLREQLLQSVPAARDHDPLPHLRGDVHGHHLPAVGVLLQLEGRRVVCNSIARLLLGFSLDGGEI